MYRRLAILISLLVFNNPTAWAGSFEQDFAVVYIDTNTEAKFGALPINRSVMADGIAAITNAGAKGLVIKFFLDQAKDELSDKRLARALARIPVVLQARLDETERSPNPLPTRFTVAGPLDTAVTGSAGWIPLPMFSDHAHDIGFVDFNSPLVPMVERYQSHIVKSLALCAIELAVGRQAHLSNQKQIQAGSHTIKVNNKNQVAVSLIAPLYGRGISFNAVLDGRAAKELKDKVVILAYDGPHIPTIETALGPMGAHQYFVNILRSLYDAK